MRTSIVILLAFPATACCGTVDCDSDDKAVTVSSPITQDASSPDSPSHSSNNNLVDERTSSEFKEADYVDKRRRRTNSFNGFPSGPSDRYYSLADIDQSPTWLLKSIDESAATDNSTSTESEQSTEQTAISFNDINDAISQIKTLIDSIANAVELIRSQYLEQLPIEHESYSIYVFTVNEHMKDLSRFRGYYDTLSIARTMLNDRNTDVRFIGDLRNLTTETLASVAILENEVEVTAQKVRPYSTRIQRLRDRLTEVIRSLIEMRQYRIMPPDTYSRYAKQIDALSKDVASLANNSIVFSNRRALQKWLTGLSAAETTVAGLLGDFRILREAQ